MREMRNTTGFNNDFMDLIESKTVQEREGTSFACFDSLADHHRVGRSRGWFVGFPSEVLSPQHTEEDRPSPPA